LESVGKTSFANRVANNSFSEKYKSTIGVKIFNHIYSENEEYIIWDIEGGSSTISSNPTYFRGSNAYLIVCDVTNQESIDSIEHFHNIVHDSYYATPIFLLFNKVDLEFNREKIELKMQEFPLTNSYYISCKTNIGIQAILNGISQRLYSNK